MKYKYKIVEYQYTKDGGTFFRAFYKRWLFWHSITNPMSQEQIRCPSFYSAEMLIEYHKQAHIKPGHYERVKTYNNR